MLVTSFSGTDLPIFTQHLPASRPHTPTFLCLTSTGVTHAHHYAWLFYMDSGDSHAARQILYWPKPCLPQKGFNYQWCPRPTALRLSFSGFPRQRGNIGILDLCLHSVDTIWPVAWLKWLRRNQRDNSMREYIKQLVIWLQPLSVATLCCCSTEQRREDYAYAMWKHQHRCISLHLNVARNFFLNGLAGGNSLL